MSATTFHYTIGSSVEFRFTTKPPADVLATLKSYGFRWSPGAKCWWRRRVTGAADIVAAIDAMLTPKRPDGPCWKCNAPEGYLRSRGAAAPVLCDECNQPDPSRAGLPPIVSAKGGGK